MRSLRAVVLAALLVPALARAQTGMGGAGGSTGTSTQTCSVPYAGGTFTASLGLAVPFNGSLQTIGSSATGSVFDMAECLCNTNDIQMQLLVTSAFSQSVANGTLQVWVGTGCDSYTNRQANTAFCQQIMNVPVNFMSFVTGTTSGSGYINIPIQSLPLFAPTKGTSMCNASDPGMATNNFYLLFAPDNNIQNATACTLNLAQNTQTPSPVTGVSLSPGDSAVTLSWTAPTGVGEQIPTDYQVLCADANGNPIPGSPNAQQAYSVCIDNHIFRRNNYTTAGASGGGTVDAGTTTSGDAGTASQPLGTADDGLQTDQTGSDAGTSGDGGVTVTTNPDFVALNPKYTCTGDIKPTGSSVSVRIGNLTNNQPYQFTVLAIDVAGNAIASGPFVAVPQPTEDLYKRFRDQGGRATGFCFIATAAFGSYEDRYVKVLRDFRDDVLLPTSLGSSFVDWYYEHSPPLADYIAQHKAARIVTQMLLWPVIGVAALVVYTSLWQKALLLALLLYWLYHRRARKAVARA